jgi:hypothetical protein
MKLKELFKIQKVPYDFEADNGDFKLTLDYKVKENWFLQAWLSVAGLQKIKQKNIPESFEAPAKLFGAIKQNTKKAVKNIYGQIRKEKPDFKVLYETIEKAIVSKKGKNISFKVFIAGHCTGE